MTPLDLARKAIADYDSNSTTWSAKELIEVIRGLVAQIEQIDAAENEWCKEQS